MRTWLTALAAWLSTLGPSLAGEIALISPPSLRPAMGELVPAFEAASGHKVSLGYALMPAMQRAIAAGAAFDVAILTPELAQAAVVAGKVRTGTTQAFARTGVGVAIRRGAARPDVSTVEAFRRTLQAAASIGYTGDGAAGNAFLAMLDRIGIAPDVKAKLRPLPGGGAVAPVARGEVEISVTTIPGIMEIPDAELAGPLPAELQSWVVYVAGIATAVRDIEAAAAFIAFLRAPPAVAVIRAKGAQPLEH